MSRAVLVALVGLAFLVGAAPAQTFDLATADDSPLWWTLADSVSASDLQRLYRDREESARRY